MGEETPELPVFELPLAIVPTETLPLHIFEDRYRRMIAHCVETETPFGIVLRTDMGAHSTGCTASVTEVTERFDDGRLNVLVTGAWRFRVLDRVEGENFPSAIVERLDDGDDPGADTAAARSAFGELIEALGAEADPEESSGNSFEIAGRVEMPVEAKQELLEAASETRRLELLVATLKRLTRQVIRTREVAARASTNGHGRYEGPSPI